MLVWNIVTRILFFLFIELQEEFKIDIVRKTLDTKITSLGAVIFYETTNFLLEFVAFFFRIDAQKFGTRRFLFIVEPKFVFVLTRRYDGGRRGRIGARDL